jgi:hypothetical protein
MYTKYNFSESKECREYFARHFIVKYNQGIKEAAALKIGTGMYIRQNISEFMDSVRCFVGSRIKKYNK